MRFFRHLVLGLLALALSASAVRAAANVTAGTPVFTPADSSRTYMDVGGVWNGTSNISATNGDTITIVYTNRGDQIAYDFAPQVVLPAGFTRVGSVTASPATVSGTPATTGTIAIILASSYDIPINGTVTVTFKLKADAATASGTYQLTHGWRWAETNGTALNSLTTALQNVVVRRGAAVVFQSPSSLTLAVNATGTYIYTITNTGLGGLFNVTFNEAASNPGTSWLWQSFGTLTTPRTATTASTLLTLPYLAPGESLVIPVNGKVTDCLNIENLFAVGDATTTAVDYFSPVVLDLKQPLITYTAPTITLAYGTTVDVSIPVQNTGAGDARGIDLGSGVRAIRLTTNFPSMGVTISEVATNWAYNATTGAFDYTGNSGVIANGTTQTLTLKIRATDHCATPPSGTLLLSSQYENRCGSTYSVPLAVGSVAGPTDQPTLSLTKTISAARLTTGGPGTFTVTLAATNLAKITTDPVVVTDTLPSAITGVVVTPSAGTVNQVGNVVTWTVTKAQLASSRTLTIAFNAATDPCNGGTNLTNTASTNTLTTTAGCSLSATASASTLITTSPSGSVTQAFEVSPAAGDGTFETGTATADLTRDNGEGEFIPFVATYSIPASFPGTWTGSTYADNFGGVTQLTLVPGSVEMNVNGAGFVAVPGANLTGGTGSLSIDLGFLAGAGSFNDANVGGGSARSLVVRYKATAPDAALSGNTRSVTQLSTLTIATGTGGCGGGTFTQGAFYTLARAAATLGISVPSQFDICETFPVTLTVGNATAEFASNMLVTLTTATGDYAYITGQTPVYGGVFSSGNITYAENSGTNPTFAYTGGDLTANGTITVNLRRKGTNASTTATAVSGTVAYDDNQTNPSTGTREFSTNGSGTPFLIRKADLSILATPSKLFVLAPTVEWDIYVTNGGTGASYATELIDIFPTGVTPDSTLTVAHTKNSVGGGGVGLVAGVVAVSGSTFTIQLGTIPSGATRRVTLVGAFSGTTCAITSVANAITARWGCDSSFVQTKTANNPTVTAPTPQIQVVHDTTNTIAKLCDTGTVEIIVKNVGSPQINDVQISEVLDAVASGLAFVPGTVRYSINNAAFNSASASYNPTGSGTTGSPYKWTSTQISALGAMTPSTGANHTVRIRFDVTASEVSNGTTPAVTASGTFKSVCGDAYNSPGTPYTVSLQKPNITVTQNGLNRTVVGGAIGTGSYVKTTYASTGNVLEWKIVIQNSGNLVAKNVRLVDVFAGSGGSAVIQGDGLASTAISNNTPLTLPDIPASTTYTYYVTETLGTTCVNALNTVTVTWGCVNNGATTASNLTTPTTNSATARVNMVPSFGGSGGGSITQVTTTSSPTVDNGRPRHVITLTNGGGPAKNVSFSLTLPDTMNYDSSVAATGSTGDGGYTGVTVTGSHPTYTFTFTNAATVMLNGKTAIAVFYLIQRSQFDVLANPNTATMATIAGFGMPETTANNKDPALPATLSDAVSVSLQFESTCGGTPLTAPVSTANLNPATPDLDLVVFPAAVQVQPNPPAPYTFIFTYTITNNGDNGSTANRIKFRIPTVGTHWASVSATLTKPGTGGTTATTAVAPYDSLVIGTLAKNATAIVTVTATTIAGPGLDAANLALVGEVEGSLFDQNGTDTTNDYSLDRAAPYVTSDSEVRGFVYNDADHSFAKASSEGGIGSTVYAKLILNSAPTVAVAAVAVDSTTGAYAFTGVSPGDYTIIVDTNNTLAAVTPGRPNGWIGTEADTGIRTVSVSVATLNNINFGLWSGGKLSGTVFKDTGTGAGTANNGVRDGTETGLSGVTVRLTNSAGSTTYDTAVTDGTGNYTLWIANSRGAVALRVVETNLAGYVSTGGTVGTTGGTYDRTNDRTVFTNVTNTVYTGVDFGDVPPNAFLTDGQQSTLPGSAVTYAHTLIATTGGTVAFSTVNTAGTGVTAGSWNNIVYQDTNGNGEVDAGEPVVGGTGVTATALTVVEGQKVNLVVKDVTPVGAPLNARNAIVVTAAFTYTNASPALAQNYTRNDITTVGAGATSGLDLVKTVDKATASPGETVTYTLTYTNNGGGPLSDIVIFDVVPGYSIHVSATNGTLPNNLTGCTILQPLANAKGNLRWTFAGTLASGGTGTVSFSVKVEN